MSLSDFLNPITALVEPVRKVIDDLHTSEEEKLEANSALFRLQNEVATRMLEYEARIIEAQSRIVTAEAQSASWITRSWRPIVMLTFAGLIVVRWLGIAAPDLTPELEAKLFTLVQIGLGGYVVGRSAEKVATSYFSAQRDNKL